MKKRFFFHFASNTIACWASAALVSLAFSQAPTSNRLPAPAPASNANTQSSASDARLQIYDIPLESVGSVAAQLQLQFANDKRVRITNEPGTGRLMVLAPDTQQQLINQYVNAVKAKTGTLATDAKGNIIPSSIQKTDYKLQRVPAKQFEDAIARLAGSKLSSVEIGNGMVSLRLATPNGMQELMQINRNANSVHVVGAPGTVMDWTQVITAIDQGQADPNRPTQIVPITPATPERIERAIRLVRFANYQQQGGNPQNPNEEETGVARIPGATQGANDPATVIAAQDSLSTGTGLIGDVEISFVNELGLVMIKGAKKDVERVLEVIEKIKQQSVDTQPDIQLVTLKHVNSQALAVIIDQINRDIYQPRQGQVNITSLVQPNALLLIGRKEAMKSLVDLISQLDAPLDPDSQLQIFKLLHTSSVDAETLIRNFFGATGGAGGGAAANAPTGLSPQIKVVSDYRTNALIVQASPRDLREVAKLIKEIDVESTPAESQIRVFPIKNTVASELQPILAAAIGGQSVGGGGQGQGQAQGGGGAQGATTTTSQARTPSSKLTVVSRDNSGVIDSGILAGVVVTTSPSINALVVRAPAKSMPLVAALIEQLDALPTTDARIKVFPVVNGDATSLALTLQQAFGLPATAGTATTNVATVGLQNLAALTGGGESALVPLRISVDARTNSIIVTGAATDLEVIEALLYRLDDSAGTARTNEVIWLRNAAANDVATALNQLLTNQRTVITQQLQQGQAISLYERVDREVFIVAEPATNSLIISATPRYMGQIREVITRLDRQQPMIAVEMLIAEVTLDDTFELGSEMGLQDSLLFDRNMATGGTLNSPAFNLGTVLSPASNNRRPNNVAGQGFSDFAVGRRSELGYGGLVLAAGNESVNLLFRALRDANRIQILSRPNLLTIDNNISVIQVGGNIPTASGTFAGGALGGVNTSVVYLPVGLIMQIQPRTNQDGLVNMIVAINRSSVDPTQPGLAVSTDANGNTVAESPAFAVTQAQTRVTAYDGQTVVLGGLIQKTRISRRRGIPWLESIPVAGLLFRFDSESEKRTELLVVMTPRVINYNDAAKLDTLKQVESSRMSWCMADILNIHGDAGLSPGNGLWGPASSPVIYPDLQPTVDINSVDASPMILGDSNPEQEEVYPQNPPVMTYPNGSLLIQPLPEGGSTAPPVNSATPYQNSSYQIPVNGQPPTNSGVSQAAYRSGGPDARIATPARPR